MSRILLKRPHKVLVLASSVLLATSLAYGDQFDNLIAGHYAGPIQLRQVGGAYFSSSFTPSSSPTTWLLRPGEYKGTFRFANISPIPFFWKPTQHLTVDLHGYWIYGTDSAHSSMCWQVQGGTCGPFAYWNQDGKAPGNLESWELFTFKAVDPVQQTVKIASSLSDFHPGVCWVSLTGNSFNCRGDEQNAAVFKVLFVPTRPQSL
jgi:hypothetical protein